MLYENEQLSLLRDVKLKYIDNEYENLMEALQVVQEDPIKKIDEPLKIFCEKISGEIKKAI